MPKYIEDEMRRQYKINYAALLKELNPKPSAEILEKLRQRYTKDREAHETNTNSDQ
jgi:hypothetical protein